MGGGSSCIPKDVHFVIIGAGYGGVPLARSFRDSGSKFTLINQTEYFHHSVASVRAAVVKGLVQKTLIPLKEVFGENFKQGRAVAIDTDSKFVRLESGEEIKYDVLIIATGTSAEFPNKLGDQNTQTAIDLYEGVAAKIERAKSILVVGGGASGTEQACEIATKFPDKEVILISSGEKLISKKTNDGFQKKLNSILARLKVKVIRGEKVLGLQDIDDNGEGPFKITTDKGTELEVDLVMKCVGVWVNNQVFKESMNGSVDKGGHLKVNEFLQVEGHDDIYAIGDCTCFEEKLAYAANEQAILLHSNFQKHYSGKKLVPWQPEKVIKVVSIVSLGPSSGLAQLRNGRLIPEFIVTMLKSRDMFVPRYWKENGLKMPR